MAVKFLKKVQKTKEQFSFKEELHRKIAGYQPGRPKVNVHASELSKQDKAWCPREYALLDLTGKKPRDEFIGTSLQVTFDYGNDLQRRLNEEYAVDHVIGNWQCRSCGKFRAECKKPKGGCSWTTKGINCHWEYEEIRPISSITGVSCGLDILLDTGKGKLKIVEVKTMVKDDFKKLVAPLAEHRARTSGYMRIVEEWDDPFRDQINTSEAIIMYVCKGFGVGDKSVKEYDFHDAAFSPYKEFVITRDDTLMEDEMNRAKALKVFRDDGKGMPCGVCNSSLDKRARSCPVIKDCWSGKHPQQLTWVENGVPAHNGKKVIK